MKKTHRIGFPLLLPLLIQSVTSLAIPIKTTNSLLRILEESVSSASSSTISGISNTLTSSSFEFQSSKVEQTSSSNAALNRAATSSSSPPNSGSADASDIVTGTLVSSSFQFPEESVILAPATPIGTVSDTLVISSFLGPQELAHAAATSSAYAASTTSGYAQFVSSARNLSNVIAIKPNNPSHSLHIQISATRSISENTKSSIRNYHQSESEPLFPLLFATPVSTNVHEAKYKRSRGTGFEKVSETEKTSNSYYAPSISHRIIPSPTTVVSSMDQKTNKPPGTTILPVQTSVLSSLNWTLTGIEPTSSLSTTYVPMSSSSKVSSEVIITEVDEILTIVITDHFDIPSSTKSSKVELETSTLAKSTDIYTSLAPKILMATESLQNVPSKFTVSVSSQERVVSSLGISSTTVNLQERLVSSSHLMQQQSIATLSSAIVKQSIKYSTADVPTTTPKTSLKPFTIVSKATRKTPKRYYCEEEWIRNDRKGDYFFEKKEVFEAVELSCKHGVNESFKNPKVKRKCAYVNGETKWEDIDLSFCLSKTKSSGFMKSIELLDISEITAEEDASFFAAIVTKNIHLVKTDIDMDIIFNTIGTLMNYANNHNQILSRVLKVLGSFTRLDKTFSKAKYAQQLEDSLNNIGSNNNIKAPYSVSNENVAVSFIPSPKTTIKISVLASEEDNSLAIQTTTAMNKSSNDSISFPASLFNGVVEGTNVFVYVLKDLPIYPTKTNEEIISNILSASVMKANTSFENLIEPIEIRFSVPTKKLTGRVSCRYWEANENGWSKRGCLTEKSSEYVLCKCDHLTSFVVIRETNENAEEGTVLHVIVLIAMVIAVCALGLTFITYLCIKTLRRIVYSQAIIYFTASLILTIIAFVGSTTFITKPLICYIFGKMLQYFTLTTFCWMLVQAVNLYRAIVVISVRRTDASYLKWMSVFAWGVPLINIGIAVYFTYDSYQTSHPRICFVDGIMFYATVLTPTVVLIIINFAIFLPIFKNIIHSEEIIKDSIENRKCENSIRAKVTLVVDLSWTTVWICGVLAYSFHMEFLIYIVHVLTPLFAILVFVMYVLLNKEAKKGWREMTHCGVPKNEGREDEMVQLKKHSKRLLDDVDSRQRTTKLNSELYGDATTKPLRSFNKKEDLV